MALAVVDGASLAAFRILFGAVMVAQTLRFWAKGWVETLWVQPTFHFTWPLFDWVRPLSAPAMKALLLTQGLAALGLMLGYHTRLSALVLALVFTACELLDKALYLNHYYLVSLLAALCVVLPVGATFSLDSRGGGRQVWSLGLTTLRAQVACVYVFAGLAKLNADWLWRGEPLRTWLQAHQGLPWGIGALLDTPVVGLGMSWAGLLHDLLIVPAVLWPPTRVPAFVLAVLFHGAIWALFPVGIFSFVMLAALTVCLAPDWPRVCLRSVGRWLRRPELGRAAVRVPPFVSSAVRSPWAPRLAYAAAALWIGVQVAVPLRHLVYPGDVNWSEQGFRFAWRVMLVEKTGSVEFEVTTRSPAGRFREARPDDLTAPQRRMMAVQADLIHDYAYHLAQRYRALGYAGVEVRADAWVSWNGRPAAQLIDPTADLLATPRGVCNKPWILEAPPGEP